MKRVAFTFDLEDHRPDDTAELRFPAITDRLLDDLDEWGVIGTVFVVGQVVRDHPDLVARVAARGHEVGLHGAAHTPLTEIGPDEFARVTAEAKDQLAQTIQTPVLGFRAPIFSLVPESAWAPQILTDLGFRYSSSVLPAHNPLFGWPAAPRVPFRWPSGLIEIPSPVFGVGRFALPLLGGVYLRVAPLPLIRWAERRAPEHAWLYCHPYDFDPDEERWILDEVGRLGSRVLWWGRRGMGKRVAGIVSHTDRRMSDMIDSFTDLAVFDPERAA